MSHHQILGVCPECESRIGPGDVLIEYSKGGKTARYAECPNCGTVVQPT